MNHEPPFDGKPCPMCPGALRNLSATAHNLAWRLEPRVPAVSSPCAVADKAVSVREAVQWVERSNLITDATPEPVRRLFDVCKRVAACEYLKDLYPLYAELKAASAAVAPLSDAHFADPRHSHGEGRLGL